MLLNQVCGYGQMRVRRQIPAGVLGGRKRGKSDGEGGGNEHGKETGWRGKEVGWREERRQGGERKGGIQEHGKEAEGVNERGKEAE